MNGRKWIQIRQYEDHLILAAGIVLAALLRYSLREFESGDLRNFTGPWYDFIKDNGGFRALKQDFTNYTPLYPYLITLAFYLIPGVSRLFALKLISIVFDFICAVFVYKIVRLKYPGGAAPLFAFLAMLFAPTVFLNSSFWGQSDVIYTTGLVACLYFLAIGRETSAFIAFGLALSFKLQAIFLAPLLFILLLKRSVSWKSFLIIPAVYVVTILPAWLAGRPFLDLLSIYLEQTGFYQELTKNAPNLYQWFSNKYYDIFYPAGMIWTAALVFLFSIAVYKSRARMTTEVIIELATISVLIMPYFLPKMHDRYFFAADVVSILFGFYFPRYFFIPVVIGMVSFFSYVPFLFRFEVIPLPFLAVVLFITIAVLFRHLGQVLTADSAGLAANDN